MSCEYGFAHLWQQDDLSDLDLLLVVQRQQQQEQEEEATGAAPEAPPPPAADTADVLQRFPAHSTILSCSPYFRAHVLRWQLKRPREDAPGEGSSDPASDPAAAPAAAAPAPAPPPAAAAAAPAAPAAPAPAARQELVLSLQDADPVPAALAVLSSMYLFQPLPQLLAGLSEVQQLQAALLGDMWQVPKITAAAVESLSTAESKPDAALSMPAVELLLGLGACPAFALPLVKYVAAACLELPTHKDRLKAYLLSVFGDLEEVWLDAGLQAALLEQPLPAMELLLSCTELKVASEDTVLFTAQAYIDQLPTAKRQQRADVQVAIEKLAPLIRCPHLSHFWVAAAALSDDPGSLLLKLQGPAKKLLLATAAAPLARFSDEIQRDEFPDAPPSWLLPSRSLQPLTSNSVQVEWTMAVEQIRAAAKESSSKQRSVRLLSPKSSPLGGIRWFMRLDAKWDADTSSTTVGLFAMVDKVPSGMVCQYIYRLECENHPQLRVNARTRCSSRSGNGLRDFFRIGPMAGGWDESLWSAALPSTGQLTLTMDIGFVGHLTWR